MSEYLPPNPKPYQIQERVNFLVNQVKGITASTTWDPPSIAVGASASTNVTVTNAVFGDFIQVSSSATISGLTMTAYVSAANTVTIVLANNTAAAVDLPSATFYLKVMK